MGLLEQLLERYGLVAVFLGSAFEGEVTLLLTGLLAHYGVFTFSSGLMVGASGGLAGDLLYFFAGRRLGTSWLRRHLARAQHIVARWRARWGVRSLFFSRYFYGVRVAAMMLWGVSGERLARFLALDTLNCLLWALSLSALGYLFAEGLSAVLEEWHRIEVGLLIGLLVFALLALAAQALSRWLNSARNAGQP